MEDNVQYPAPSEQLLKDKNYVIVDQTKSAEILHKWLVFRERERPRRACTCRRGPQAKMILDLIDGTPNTSNWARWSEFRVTGVGGRHEPIGPALGLANFTIKYEDESDDAESEIDRKSLASWGSETAMPDCFHGHVYDSEGEGSSTSDSTYCDEPFFMEDIPECIEELPPSPPTSAAEPMKLPSPSKVPAEVPAEYQQVPQLLPEAEPKDVKLPSPSKVPAEVPAETQQVPQLAPEAEPKDVKEMRNTGENACDTSWKADPKDVNEMSNTGENACATIRCRDCTHWFPRTSFTKTQLSKNSNIRRCKECIEKAWDDKGNIGENGNTGEKEEVPPIPQPPSPPSSLHIDSASNFSCKQFQLQRARRCLVALSKITHI